MELRTAMNKRDTAAQATRDLYDIAEICGMEQGEIADCFAKIIFDMGQAPRWAVEYVHGHRDCLVKGLYRDCLTFGAFYKGAFYSTDSSRADYYAANGITPHAWTTDGEATDLGHYWTTTKEPRPFYVSGKES